MEIDHNQMTRRAKIAARHHEFVQLHRAIGALLAAGGTGRVQLLVEPTKNAVTGELMGTIWELRVEY